MANELNLNQATSSTFMQDYSTANLPSMTTDGISASGETRWTNSDWGKYWGLFNANPKLKSAILMKGIWDVGKSYTCDEWTKVRLDYIKGSGKSTFDDILFNMDVVRYIGGDSYAEIIWNDDKKRDFPLNLKPLDPSSIVHVFDDKGMLIRFEQVSKIKGKEAIKFDPKDIFYLASDILADQIHGISKIKVMEDIIKADAEFSKDMQKLAHFQAKPFILWKLKTDDTTKIANFKAKIENARKIGDDMFIPDDDDAVTHEVIQLSPSQFVIAWGQLNTNEFYRAMGLPLVLFGQAGTTESGGKIEYLAHEQVFELDQSYIERQVWQQLHLRINLNSPVSLLENLQTDESKDANQGLDMPKGEMMMGAK